MQVTVRFFAMMAQQLETGKLLLDLPDHASVDNAVQTLRAKYPRLRWPGKTLFAINQEYAAPESPLAPGDELAIIPPVSGGSPR